MQFVRSTTAAALFLLFGTIAPSYAQQKEEPGKQPEKQPQQQARPAQQPQQKQQQQARPAQQPQQRAQQTQQQKPQPQQKQPQQQPARPAQQPQQQRAQQTQQQQPPQRTQQQAVAWQQQKGWLKQGAWPAHSTWQQDRAQQWSRQHRTWAQRGGYGGYYIPQNTFTLSFGSQHWFRMPSPVFYMGYPRFSYGGFSFLLVDPYPESWAENWYSTDDVYIAYDNGYYLYDRRYPGVGLAITVEM